MFGTGSVVFAADEPELMPFGAKAEETDITPDIATISRIEPVEKAEKKDDFKVIADHIQPNSAMISWSGSEFYLSYTLCRYNIISESWEDVVTTADKRVYIAGLSEDVDYKYAVKNSADKKILGIVEFTTGLKRANVAIKHRSSTAVELSITNVDENVVVDVLRREEGKPFEKIGVSEDKSTYVDNTVDDAKDYEYSVKCSTMRNGKVHKSRRGSIAHVKTLLHFGMPTGETDGECKTFAYYTAVTARSTPQYQLLNSEQCYTDEATGIRMVDGYYCVALGSYYGTKIGNKYRVTIQDGDVTKEINVILCDQKADRHTNATHQYAMNNKDILEFYIERAKRPAGIAGDYGVLPQFRGKIVAIEQYVDNIDEETIYVAKKEVVEKDKAKEKAKAEAEAKKKAEEEKKKEEKAKKEKEKEKLEKAKKKAEEKEKKKNKKDSAAKKQKKESTTKKEKTTEKTTAEKETETQKETTTEKETTTAKPETEETEE